MPIEQPPHSGRPEAAKLGASQVLRHRLASFFKDLMPRSKKDAVATGVAATVGFGAVAGPVDAKPASAHEQPTQSTNYRENPYVVDTRANNSGIAGPDAKPKTEEENPVPAEAASKPGAHEGDDMGPGGADVLEAVDAGRSPGVQSEAIAARPEQAPPVAVIPRYTAENAIYGADAKKLSPEQKEPAVRFLNEVIQAGECLNNPKITNALTFIVNNSGKRYAERSFLGIQYYRENETLPSWAQKDNLPFFYQDRTWATDPNRYDISHDIVIADHATKIQGMDVDKIFSLVLAGLSIQELGNVDTALLGEGAPNRLTGTELAEKYKTAFSFEPSLAASVSAFNQTMEAYGEAQPEFSANGIAEKGRFKEYYGAWKIAKNSGDPSAVQNLVKDKLGKK